MNLIILNGGTYALPQRVFYDDVNKFLIEIIKAISNIRSLTDCEGIKVYS